MPDFVAVILHFVSERPDLKAALSEAYVVTAGFGIPELRPVVAASKLSFVLPKPNAATSVNEVAARGPKL
jgi:hypothetical protein